MEAGHLRENPQTPQRQETLQAITSGCKRLIRLFATARANKQGTERSGGANKRVRKNHLREGQIRTSRNKLKQKRLAKHQLTNQFEKLPLH